MQVYSKYNKMACEETSAVSLITKSMVLKIKFLFNLALTGSQGILLL